MPTPTPDSPTGVQVVWFKRDLRVGDHVPLYEAARRGPVLCLFVYEPALLTSAEFDGTHFAFLRDCLHELDRDLRVLGGRLTTRRGDVPQVFADLHRELAPAGGIAAIWSHEETGLRWSFDRDLALQRWCREHNVPWHEAPSNGVVRRLRDRDGWASRWQRRMIQPLLPPPDRIVTPASAARDDDGVLAASDVGVASPATTQLQPGGVDAAREVLRTFLNERGANYRSDMSTPVEGEQGCSRLSPYLAFGSVSVRQIYQTTRRRIARLGNARGDHDAAWRASLRSFEARLRWHCHFIQKLEDEPDLEFHNMNRAYDGLREDSFDQARFDAWREGRTGYPMIDACMRSLHRTRWINFRMRAMLVSFASYHLWLHWRPTAVYLATQFLDFEPGIHFSQFQMQSGVTGINTIRIYSPRKQQQDQDPTGAFVRQWVPELADVPDRHLAEPHRMSAPEQQDSKCRIGTDYPEPIVDHTTAYNSAKERIYSVKKSGESRTQAQTVYRRHGSRRRQPPRRRTQRS